jgi:hypothetical protein
MQSLSETAAHQSKADKSNPGRLLAECVCWHLSQPPTGKVSMLLPPQSILRKTAIPNCIIES